MAATLLPSVLLIRKSGNINMNDNHSYNHFFIKKGIEISYLEDLNQRMRRLFIPVNTMILFPDLISLADWSKQ